MLCIICGEKDTDKCLPMYEGRIVSEGTEWAGQPVCSTCEKQLRKNQREK
jgi:hypothetical protein